MVEEDGGRRHIMMSWGCNLCRRITKGHWIIITSETMLCQLPLPRNWWQNDDHGEKTKFCIGEKPNENIRVS